MWSPNNRFMSLDEFINYTYKTGLPKEPKLVINPLALVLRNFNRVNIKTTESLPKIELCNDDESDEECLLIVDKSHESIISISDDEECDVSESVTAYLETSAAKVNENAEKRKGKVLNLLCQYAVSKESIAYSLGLIRDFVTDRDAENIVFADKFPFAIIKFLGLLFDVKPVFIETTLDRFNFKIYNDLIEVVQNKPFRVFWQFEAKLRRITFSKNYIASDGYETSSFIKMDSSDAQWSLSESEMNMAPEQNLYWKEVEKKVNLKSTEITDFTENLTVDPKLLDKTKTRNVQPRGNKSVMEDRTESAPPRKARRLMRRQSSRFRKVEKVQTLKEMSTSVLQEGLETPVQCSIAERMMRKMGWDGGALGASGTGITEPIKPDINRKASFGLGHERAIAEPTSSARAGPRRDEGHSNPTEHKAIPPLRRQKTKREIRKEKRLETLNLRKEMRRLDREAALQAKEAYNCGELDVWGKDEEDKERGGPTEKQKGGRFQLVALERLLEFVCRPEEHEMWFDDSYNDKRRAQIHKLVDNINEGGRKHMPSEWDRQLVEEICSCTDTYLVSESFGEGQDRRLSIYKLPLQSVMYVDEAMLLSREDATRCWNQPEVVAGNLWATLNEFLRDTVKEEVRFTGQWSSKTRGNVNNFLKKLKQACDIDTTLPPMTEIQRLMHDAYMRRPNVTLQIVGQVLKHYKFNSRCPKIIKVPKKDPYGDRIVID